MATTCGCVTGLSNSPAADRYRAALTQLVAGSASPTLRAAHAELERGLQGLLGVSLVSVRGVSQDGALVIGTPTLLAVARGAAAVVAAPGLAGICDSQYHERWASHSGHCCGRRCRRSVRRLSLAAPDADPAAAGPVGVAGAASNPAARSQSLGQSRSQRRARLCRPVDLGLAQASRLHRSALRRLCPCQRFVGHQCDGAHQRQFERRQPHGPITWRRQRRWPMCCAPTASACS